MKKGFTLIELLSVIIIMSIIALITVPVIIEIIGKAHIGSFKSSVLTGYKSIEYSLLNNKLLSTSKSGIKVSELNLKNNFKSGKYLLKDENVYAKNITNGKYCANGNINELIITKGDCSYTKEQINIMENTMIKSYSDDLENSFQLSGGEEVYADDFYSKEYNSKIKNIKFVQNIAVPENKIIEWDLSLKNNGKVKGWIVLNNEDNSYYDLYIGSEQKIYANYDLQLFFSPFTNLTSIDFENFDTSLVNNMSQMFYNCFNLADINLSGFDTSLVRSMSYMFYNCQNLKNINLENFDTSNVTNLSGMFSKCINIIELDLGAFDTSLVKNMSNFLSGCKSLNKLDLSSFDTSNVTNMKYMFGGCQNLKNINLGNFNTSKVTDMRSMFHGCNSLIGLDLNNFDTSLVTNMEKMFSKCSSLNSLDLSSFNTSNVTNMSELFSYSSNLKTIYISNNWVAAKEATDMFYECGTSVMTLK